MPVWGCNHCTSKGSALPRLPSPVCPGRLTHRIVAEELTVAAVTELPIAWVGGARGARAALRAAVLFLAQTLICLTGQATVCKSVPLAPRVPAAREKGPEVRGSGAGREDSRNLEQCPDPSYRSSALHLPHQASGEEQGLLSVSTALGPSQMQDPLWKP